ncbi:ATP-binding protein [Methylosinus sp. RM1]|uniref:sensor histidine kinase n=1 Tax=Methylosinus sp. RM1 TaxID=2583817 RepID=UPI0014076EF6|nr:ATP-binding protein [Methylosinus sp. RM1]
MATALALPLAGLFFFRIYENQLIHQTESELIGQSAAIAAVMRRELETRAPANIPLGTEVSAPRIDPAEPYTPIMPTLDLTADDMLGQRPDAQPAAAPADAEFVALGARLGPDLVEIQQVTLAGFRLLDPKGVVIAGREEIGLSLAHVEEVAEALQGQYHSVMRSRISKHEPPPLYSWSRGTAVRVFTAMPIILRGRVAGVVYSSRTPSNIFKSFYDERGKVALAALTIVSLALLIGFVFQRTITRPMRELMRRTAAIGRGDRSALRPLAHHGAMEIAQLSQSFLDMATNLQNRSDFIATFAAHVSHELKSPLTSIQGAAELLRDDLDPSAPGMNIDDRRRFLDNILSDTGRLTAVVQRLRELARAEATPTLGTTTMADAVTDLRSTFESLGIEAHGDIDRPIRISAESARIILSHLADNAARHGATQLTIAASAQGEDLRIAVRDNGSGVSRANRDKVFDSFFTTRRDSGGTGMGLAIVRAMLQAHGGSIALAEDGEGAPPGAEFVLTIPLAERDRPQS